MNISARNASTRFQVNYQSKSLFICYYSYLIPTLHIYWRMRFCSLPLTVCYLPHRPCHCGTDPKKEKGKGCWEFLLNWKPEVLVEMVSTVCMSLLSSLLSCLHLKMTAQSLTGQCFYSK